MKSSSNQLLFSKCSFIAGLMGLVLLTGITTTSEAGQFEGTLWSFHLIPKNPNEKSERERFARKEQNSSKAETNPTNVVTW
jgi:hypothetical protein